jgi:hypothetical protein
LAVHKLLTFLALGVEVGAGQPSATAGLVAVRQELAHPQVQGAAGPYRRVTVTLTRPAGQATAPFIGRLDIGHGKRLKLAGPDEPDGFFYLDPKAVIFTPINRRQRRNGIIILYNSSKIGPGNGTDRRALVYRVGTNIAQRQPKIEDRLEGVANAAQARAEIARLAQ